MSADPVKARWDLSRWFALSTLDELVQSPKVPFPPPLRVMFNDHIYPPSKDYMSQPLYVRQPCSLQIIQLVECSSPPPQQQNKYSPSRLSSSSYSDSHSSSSSAYHSSSSSLSAGSSYCSSAEVSAAPVPPSLDNRDPSVDDTYHTRQRRVSLWRDAVYSKDVAGSSPSVQIYFFGFYFFNTETSHAAAARPASPSQKRKTPDGDLANSDSVVSFLTLLGTGFHFTDTHVRPPPPTPHHASPLAPHRVPILVLPVTRTFLPLSLSDNMLLQVEMPTKRVASPSNTGLNNLSPFDSVSHSRTHKPTLTPLCSLPSYAMTLSARLHIRSTPFRHFLLL